MRKDWYVIKYSRVQGRPARSTVAGPFTTKREADSAKDALQRRHPRTMFVVVGVPRKLGKLSVKFKRDEPGLKPRPRVSKKPSKKTATPKPAKKKKKAKKRTKTIQKRPVPARATRKPSKKAPARKARKKAPSRAPERPTRGPAKKAPKAPLPKKAAKKAPRKAAKKKAAKKKVVRRPAPKPRKPAKKAPARKKPAKKVPARKKPAKKAPARKKPAKKAPRKKAPKKFPLQVAIGQRVHDGRSSSPIFQKDRAVRTYYHHADNVGLAQSHALDISEKLSQATNTKPHEFNVRLRSDGGSRETMQEVLQNMKESFELQGLGGYFRTFKNSDGSIDGEIRIDTGGRPYKDVLLTFGDIVDLPRGI